MLFRSLDVVDAGPPDDCPAGIFRAGEVRLVVLDGTSPNLSGAKDPCRAVVRRAGVDDIKDVIRS